MLTRDLSAAANVLVVLSKRPGLYH